MDEIKVPKTKLLAVLKENRENHRTAFEAALNGWRAQCETEIGRLYDEAKANKLKQAFLNLPRPEDHTGDYDRTIQMLEMDIELNVMLHEHEFRTYVQDDWGWKQQWTTSNSGYMAKK